MDERSQQGHPMQPQHAASDHGPAHAPWPTYAAPSYGAPIAGQAPYPGPQPQAHAPMQTQPSMQQFQYAANGFVLPGASQGQPAPMSAHGGTIGSPQPQPQQFQQPYAPAQPPAAPPAPMHAQPHHGAPAMAAPAMQDPYAQPQAWAFPTPQGMQMVQPGAAPSMVPGTLPVGVQATTVGRRVRWETIVPALAVVCLVAAIGLFMHDFDRITGRDAAAGTSSEQASDATVADADSAATGGGTATTPADASKVVAQATALFRQGRFDESADLLHPVLDGPSPDPAAVALHDKVDAANTREDALLARLAKERASSKWTAVVVTIGQIERLRPLDARLISLRTRARAAAKVARSKAVAARAAAARKNAGPSASGAGGSHAGGTHSPPATGARPPASTGATPRPPASVPSGSMPPRPDAPNPSPGGGANAGVTGGGAPAAGTASNCHTHEGVTSCHD